VTNKKLHINYGFFNRKGIPIVDAVSCEPIKASLRRYGGVGINMELMVLGLTQLHLTMLLK